MAAVSVWSLPPAQRYRFLRGRDHHNRIRQWRVEMRRSQITKALARDDFTLAAVFGRSGVQRQLALRFHVSQETIRRDLNAILAGRTVCPVCGQPIHR